MRSSTRRGPGQRWPSPSSARNARQHPAVRAPTGAGAAGAGPERNGNRYEHFEASSDTALVDDHELRVYVWTQCTYVAE
ncbi:DUF5988 family protein [Streptomyces sp. NPDC087428]|uniref:DUF5988 family protein n=1 Tax=Streptomyces sp. NPDC087428 TaxID=3365788 RepID=UPI003817917E